MYEEGGAGNVVGAACATGNCNQRVAADGIYSARRVLGALRNSTWATTDPAEACVFVPNVDGNTPLRARSAQMAHFFAHRLWRGGRNHLLFNFGDFAWHAFGLLSRVPFGRALLAQASAGGRAFWPNFDVSMGLPPTAAFSARTGGASSWRDPEQLAHARARPLWLSFLGKPDTAWRSALAKEPAGSVLAHRKVLFQDAGDKDRRQVRPQLQLWRGRGSNYYDDLLANSTFALCPEGEGRASYRVAEALRLGAIPVIVAGRGGKRAEPGGSGVSGYVLPFSDGAPTVPWGILFDSDGVGGAPTMGTILAKLQAMTAVEVDTMQRSGAGVFRRCFESTEKVVLCVIAQIAARVKRALDLEREQEQQDGSSGSGFGAREDSIRPLNEVCNVCSKHTKDGPLLLLPGPLL